MARDVVGVLLAAGAGRRFGGSKLLARLPDGSPVGTQAARNLVSAVAHCVAVVRAQDTALAALFESQGLEVLVNHRAEQGIGESLALAVCSLPAQQGWLVALGDMPWVPPRVIGRVADALRGGALLAAPVCQGRRGHPVGFAVPLGPQLSRIRGDRGASQLLMRHRHRMQCLHTDDSGVLLDVDRPQDLDRRQRGGC